MNKWTCVDCKWEGQEDDIIKQRYFLGSQEEPEEWLWYCPDCNGTHLEKNVYCNACEKVIVKYEGDRCAECAADQAHYFRDQSKDDFGL